MLEFGGEVDKGVCVVDCVLCTRSEETDGSECSLGTGGMRRDAEPAAPLVIRMGVPTREGVRERGVFGVLDITNHEDEEKMLMILHSYQCSITRSEDVCTGRCVFKRRAQFGRSCVRRLLNAHIFSHQVGIVWDPSRPLDTSERDMSECHPRLLHSMVADICIWATCIS